jgi:hypothetical protein
MVHRGGGRRRQPEFVIFAATRAAHTIVHCAKNAINYTGAISHCLFSIKTESGARKTSRIGKLIEFLAQRAKNAP